ncbi:orange carotenoid protein N-terminal domain-containing protein [Planktothrix pseudagardhii]|uniref:Orange carotenoid-binding domain-containing protein n=1 Tax=Planktothrix pseudagardhii TaxID=132604 RepID=A0A9W4CP18_9CYAN|nr:orange carotenoid protein N-terminal domain-containing protein [Planktothrix pseudagardhii]CAD5966480.1 Orange carotenoid-binding domain-containing protein [Planktothrix pseudagardhii]
MTFTPTQQDLEQALSKFRGLDVDTQLAFLWFVYTKMGQSITPAAPGAAQTEIAEGLYNQVQALSFEEQLQAQRDFLQSNDTQLCREYGSLSDNTKLLFWYRLAQGMDAKTIIPMPENYEFSQEGKALLGQLENMDFEQQITFLRQSVEPTGAAPQSGSGL